MMDVFEAALFQTRIRKKVWRGIVLEIFTEALLKSANDSFFSQISTNSHAFKQSVAALLTYLKTYTNER